VQNAPFFGVADRAAEHLAVPAGGHSGGPCNDGACLSASLRQRGSRRLPSSQTVRGVLAGRHEPSLGLRQRTVRCWPPFVGQPPRGSAEGTG
jgi:hypothetical protein